MRVWGVIWHLMDTAFVIGNGESRNIFPIERLKGHGVIYGCNAIYRDHPKLCDHIVAVNPPMYDELKRWHNDGKEAPNIYSIDDISKWNYICDGDRETDVPKGLKIYRIWRGGNIKKGGRIKTNDFSKNKGSGFSGADGGGVRDKECCHTGVRHNGCPAVGDDTPSRIQNNIYKDSINYPDVRA
jgi:hypothetical protein